MKYVQLASLSTPAAVSTWFQDELVNRGVDAAYTYYVLSLLRGTEDSDQEEDFHCSTTRHPAKAKSKRFSQQLVLRRKQCAIECLESAADSKEGFESLVEELLDRLNSPAQFHRTDSGSVEDHRQVDSGDDSDEQHPRQISLAERAKLYFDAFPALQVNLRLSGSAFVEEDCFERPTAKPSITRDAKSVVRKKKQRNKSDNPDNKSETATSTQPSVDESPALTNDWQKQKSERQEKRQGSSVFEENPQDNPISSPQTLKMGSMFHEESLITNLAEKFDSKLAAIWADVPSVDKSPWLSIDVKEGRHLDDVGCDDVIFSIPNSFSIFDNFRIDVDNDSNNNLNDHEDDDQEFCSTYPASYPSSNFGFIGDYHSATLHRNESAPQAVIDDEKCIVESFQTAFAFNRLGKDETTDSREACVPTPPALCLKNSTLNYDREKTAFSEVVPSRQKNVSASGGYLNELKVPFSEEDDGEDLLISPRTHFTPIRMEPEDLEERPPSSSLGEMASFNLLPEPPKRSSTKSKAAQKSTRNATNGEAASVVNSNTSSMTNKKKKTVETVPERKEEIAVAAKPKKITDDSIKSLWKMIEPGKEEAVIQSDILGVAHCWQESAITYSGASKELRQEILDEEDELLNNIFSKPIQIDLKSEESDEPLSENVVEYSLEESSQKESSECQSLEYLSHFSSGAQLDELLATPELYDSAIVTSVRSIQDLQRTRKKQQKKPCTFYLEGNCRRTDCKFSHELAAITCRFWEEGSCFKGMACPFLHGYASLAEGSSDDEDAPEPDNLRMRQVGCFKKDAKRTQNKFVIESEQDFPSLNGVPNKGSIFPKGSPKKSSTMKSQKVAGSLLLTTKKTTAARKKKKRSLNPASGIQLQQQETMADGNGKKKLSEIAKKSRDAISALLRDANGTEK